MSGADTTLGGDGRAFPDTTQGLAGGLAALDGPAYARALDTLCRRYWKPVYTFLRLGRGRGNEDAKDLTQAFFASLLEDPALRRYDPARGGFRAYLKALVRNFAAHADRDAGRLKRGGGTARFSIDEALPEVAAGSTSDPEKEFDRVWVEDLVQAAVSRVRARLGPERFRVYEDALAGREGGDAKALWKIREEIRGEIRAALAESAGSDGELEDEWKRLLGG
jgi:RNA polymerase sigma-70 factor (ECF subfamily)